VNALDKKEQLAGLYENYYDKIARYIYVRIGNRNEAEDMAGEVFLKALKSLSNYQEKGIPMQAWLFKIAHNIVVDYLRKNAKNKTISVEDVEIYDKTDQIAEIERHTEIERVKKAMELLTAGQREVIRLRFFGELSSREVANLLKKSDGAVREMQRAALLKMRHLLSNNKTLG
jgi:RNA polymerase sigma-70 factor (ECF subfamily)